MPAHQNSQHYREGHTPVNKRRRGERIIRRLVGAKCRAAAVAGRASQAAPRANIRAKAGEWGARKEPQVAAQGRRWE